MKFLKALGWIFVPYIMIFFQWKKIGTVGKAVGTVWAVIALIIGIAQSSSDKKSQDASPKPAAATTTSNAPAQSPQKQETKKEDTSKAFKVGDEVQAGNLSFKVNSVKKADQVGDDVMNKKADGVFLIVNVTVKNNDKEARTIDTNLFKLVSGSTSYNASAEADMYANKDNSFFLKQLNPGVSTTGNIVFDIPKDMKGEKLEVESGLGFSGGKKQTIDLGQ
jgi:hypothetical protein